MSRRSRLLRWLNRETPRVSLAVAIAPYQTNPLHLREHDHCECCDRFDSASCPLTHTTACPEHQQDAGTADLLAGVLVMVGLLLVMWAASAIGYLLTGVKG